MDHKKSFLHVKCAQAIQVKRWQWKDGPISGHVWIFAKKERRTHIYTERDRHWMSDHPFRVSRHRHTLAWGHNYQQRITQLTRREKTDQGEGKKKARNEARSNLKQSNGLVAKPHKSSNTGQDRCTYENRLSSHSQCNSSSKLDWDSSHKESKESSSYWHLQVLMWLRVSGTRARMFFPFLHYLTQSTLQH